MTRENENQSATLRKELKEKDISKKKNVRDITLPASVGLQ
jgi:hypothetical protein